MTEYLTIPDTTASKEERYSQLFPQIEGLIMGENDLIANLSNCIAAIHLTMGFLWTGIYFVRGNELVLGPFQGPVACTRIRKGRGVCGKAWEQQKTIIVEDVSTFDDHISCSSLSRSEIVVPVFGNGEVVWVLDIDGAELAAFDGTDAEWLEKIMRLIEPR
ncbi:MAG TPA: GAF domain-containing protein [Bacteroidia bacterium]|nr:GAF domain-containing protein [Bacteroidia bacterium]